MPARRMVAGEVRGGQEEVEWGIVDCGVGFGEGVGGGFLGRGEEFGVRAFMAGFPGLGRTT